MICTPSHSPNLQKSSYPAMYITHPRDTGNSPCPVIESIQKALDGRRVTATRPSAIHATANAATSKISQNEVYEAEIKSTCDFANPAIDVELTVVFTSPSGKSTPHGAFWDGGDVWRVRFSPDEIGEWTWESRCSEEKNRGLNGQARLIQVC